MSALAPRPTSPRPVPSSRGTIATGPSPALPDPVDPTDPAPAPVNDGTRAETLAQLVAYLAAQTGPEELALEAQREAFDRQTRIQAEIERETNALRDLAMQQAKFDDEALKKWITLI